MQKQAKSQTEIDRSICTSEKIPSFGHKTNRGRNSTRKSQAHTHTGINGNNNMQTNRYLQHAIECREHK